MTEVTRIACPGCRSMLRFEPEALDFPANCAACECRFSAGIYVRVACPKCHCGSKIRESYRGQNVRCVRCRHEFLADEGITPGGGGRLLVAKMLDTGLLEPPETIQPFLGHARVETERKASPTPAPTAVTEDDRTLEAERLRAQAIAERDRMAEETALFKAILARLVTNAPEPRLELEPGHPRLSTLVDAPARSAEEQDELDRSIARLTEERDRFEHLVRDLQAELDRTRNAADRAEERAKRSETTLARAIQGHEDAGREASRLVDDLEAAARERISLSVTVDRLNQAVLSARAGEVDAIRRLGSLADGLRHSDEELNVERRRGQELARLVEQLKAEIEAVSSAKAASAAEAASSAERAAVHADQVRALEAERLELLEQLDRARLETDAEAEVRHHADRDELVVKLAELERLRGDLETEIQSLRGELDQVRSAHDTTSAEHANRLRELEQERLGLLDRLDRTRVEAETAAETRHREEREGLAARLAEAERGRLALDRENHGLRGELEKSRQAETARVAEDDNRAREWGQERVGLLDQLDRARLEAETFSEAEASRIAERQELDSKLADLEQSRTILDRENQALRDDLDRARKAEAVRSAERDAEHDGRAREFDQERRSLLARLDETKLEAQARQGAEREELAAKLADLQQAIAALKGENQRLLAELELARDAEQARSNEVDGRAEELEEERRGLMVQLDRAKLEADEDGGRQELATRIDLVEARHREGRQDLVVKLSEVEAKHRAGREFLVAKLSEAEAKHREGRELLASQLTEVERGRIALETENQSLRSELERIRLESKDVLAGNERLSEAVDSLLEQNQSLDDQASKLLAENRRMATQVVEARSTPVAPSTDQKFDAIRLEKERLEADLERSRLEASERAKAAEAVALEKERLAAELEFARTEADRRQKSLASEIHRIKQAYEKLVAAHETDQKERARPGNGQSNTALRGEEAHRDLAMTLLYGDQPNGGDHSDPPSH